MSYRASMIPCKIIRISGIRKIFACEIQSLAIQLNESRIPLTTGNSKAKCNQYFIICPKINVLLGNLKGNLTQPCQSYSILLIFDGDYCRKTCWKVIESSSPLPKDTCMRTLASSWQYQNNGTSLLTFFL